MTALDETSDPSHIGRNTDAPAIVVVITPHSTATIDRPHIPGQGKPKTWRQRPADKQGQRRVEGQDVVRQLGRHQL
jgi:hypothetical protein